MSEGTARGQLAGSPGLGMLQPWTKLTSIYVGTTQSKFSSRSLTTGKLPVLHLLLEAESYNKYLDSKKERPGRERLGTALKTNEVFVF